MAMRPLPTPVPLSLEEAADALGDAQMALAGVIQFGQRLSVPVKHSRLIIVARALQRIAARLLRCEFTDDSGREARPTYLIDQLLGIADQAELLSAQITMVEELPLPMRTATSDRVLQTASLLRLTAAKIKHLSYVHKTVDLPIAA